MNATEIVLAMFTAILILMLYVSALTGFFASYYYDEKKYKKIKTSGTIEPAYGASILLIVGFFFITFVVIVFYQEVAVGIIIFFVLLFLAVLVRTLVKRNMQNIIKISFGRKGLTGVIFKNKILTLLLSPFSTWYIFFLIIMLLAGTLIYEKFG